MRALVAVVVAVALALPALVAPAAAETKTLTIGISISYSGKFAKEGELGRQGYELFRELVNERGGIKVGNDRYMVEYKYYDDKSDQATAASRGAAGASAMRMGTVLTTAPSRSRTPPRIANPSGPVTKSFPAARAVH